MWKPVQYNVQDISRNPKQVLTKIIWTEKSQSIDFYE